MWWHIPWRGSLSTVSRAKFRPVGFCGRRKTGEPRENTSEQGENQQQTQRICDASSRIQTQATLIDAVSLTTLPTLLPTAFGELNVTAYMYIHVIKCNIALRLTSVPSFAWMSW